MCPRGTQEGHQTWWDRSGVRKRFQVIWLLSKSSRRWLGQPGLGDGPGKKHCGRHRREITLPVWEHCMAKDIWKRRLSQAQKQKGPGQVGLCVPRGRVWAIS